MPLLILMKMVLPLQGTSVVSPIIPLAIVIYLAYLVARTSKTNLLQNHPCLFVMTFGFMAAKVTFKLVVSFVRLSTHYSTFTSTFSHMF